MKLSMRSPWRRKTGQNHAIVIATNSQDSVISERKWAPITSLFSEKTKAAKPVIISSSTRLAPPRTSGIASIAIALADSPDGKEQLL